MSSRTVDLPTTAPSSAAGAESFPHPNPVCTEIGVSVQGSNHAAEGQTSQSFLEQTSTVIVFAQGGVVRLSENVAPGQILIVRHLRSNQEAACRVISVKSNPNVKGYVEVEFLQPAPGFWGMDFPSTEAKAPSAVPARPESAAESIKPPAPAIPKPVSPAPAPRYTVPPAEDGNGAAGPGLSFLPDLLDTLGLPGETKLRAPEQTARLGAPRTTKESAPAKPPTAPWSAGLPGPATPKAEGTKGAPGAEGRYVSDLLDTLTPVGETILREKPKSAAPAPPSLPAPPAYVPVKPPSLTPTVAKAPTANLVDPAHAEPAIADHIQPRVTAQAALAASRASAPALPSVGPEVAPLLPGGQLLGGEVAQGRQKQGWPKPMRILAGAAALALVLAAGAGVYRWEKKAGRNVSVATASQPAAAVSAPGSAPVPLSPRVSSSSNPAPGAANAPASAGTQPTANNTRGSAQANSNPASSAAKAPSTASPVVRGPAVASMKMSAPAAAAPATNQAAPTLTAAMPGSIPGASESSVLPGAMPSRGPAAPPAPRTSSGVQQPRLLAASAPTYPYAAQAEHVQGDVSVDLLIDENGKVAAMTVVSGPTLLREAALAALRQRKYAPAMLDGKPTKAHIVVIVHFQL